MTVTVTKNNWLFLALGLLLGAALTAGYYVNRWHAEELRLATSRIDSHLNLLERIERRDNSGRDVLRSELRTQINALGARDDLSFFQCTNRRRIFERAQGLPDLTSGDAVESRQTAELFTRFRAGGFVCEKR